MTQCRIDASTPTSATPSQDCVAETSYEVGALTAELRGTNPPREQQRRAELLLSSGRALLDGMASGPERAALAQGLSALEAELSRVVAQQAIASAPSSATGPSAATVLIRNIDRAARARVSQGSTHHFVRAVAGKMTMSHIRALGRLDAGEVRERLARLQSETVGDAFLTDAEVDGAMDQIEGRLAQRFETAVRERALHGLERRARSFERMANEPTGPECGRLCALVREGRADGLLDQLERVGANVLLLREVNTLASTGANIDANVERRMSEALGVAAARLRQQASTVAQWSAPDTMEATRAFPGAKEEVAARMALNGIVQSAVEARVGAAESQQERVDAAFSIAWFAANVVVGLATGGSSLLVSASASAAMGLGEGIMEARETRMRADRDAAANLAGLVDDGRAARSSCEAEVAGGPGALLRVAVGTALGEASGTLVEGVAGRLAGATVDAASGVDPDSECGR